MKLCKPPAPYLSCNALFKVILCFVVIPWSEHGVLRLDLPSEFLWADGFPEHFSQIDVYCEKLMILMTAHRGMMRTKDTTKIYACAKSLIIYYAHPSVLQKDAMISLVRAAK